MRFQKVAITLLFLIVFSFVSKGQYHPIVVYFTSVTEGNSIVLNWAIKGGNTCSGIRLLHSVDDSIYNEVGEIQGICGDAAADISYSLRHEDVPSQGIQYYKLELGSQGISSPLEVEFYFVSNNEVGLYPNPGISQFNLYVPKAGEGAVVQVYNAQSKLLKEQALEVNESNEVDMMEYPQGMYILHIRNEKGHYKTLKWIKI